MTGAPKWSAAPELAADLVDDEDGDFPPASGPVSLLEESEAPDMPMLEGDEVTLAPEKAVLLSEGGVLACKSCDNADESRPLSEVSLGEELLLDICKTFEPEPDPTKV